jgi:hypothetical protein
MSTELKPSTSPAHSSSTDYHTRRLDLIHRINGYGDEGYTYIPVVVIGAGESGICMAYKLKQVYGHDAFRVYDRQAGVGGTWWINRYPGAACDVPAIFYSFSFALNPKWTAFHPSGPEIYAYMQDVCDRFKLTDKIQLNTEVLGAKWLEEEELWEVQLKHFVTGMGDLSVPDREKRIEELGEYSVFSSTETVRCKVLITAVGGLVRSSLFFVFQANLEGRTKHHSKSSWI